MNFSNRISLFLGILLCTISSQVVFGSHGDSTLSPRAIQEAVKQGLKENNVTRFALDLNTPESLSHITTAHTINLVVPKSTWICGFGLGLGIAGIYLAYEGIRNIIGSDANDGQEAPKRKRGYWLSGAGLALGIASLITMASSSTFA